MCLRERINFDKVGFYNGYLAGLRFARDLIAIANKDRLCRQAKEILETLDSFLETEEEIVLQHFTREVYTTKFEKVDLERYITQILKERARTVEAVSQ